MEEGDLLARLTDLTPSERTAMKWCGHERSYAELVAAVDEVAHTLLALGAARTNVLVHGPLSPAYVVGLLACLRSGAVPVPVDAGLTADQYAWVEGIARPSVIVTSDVSPVAHWRGVGTPHELVLDAATGSTVLTTAPRPGPGTTWRYTDPDAGYLIPTSGSTGAPKAIVGSRSGLHAFLSWFTEEFRFGATDICAAVTRANFDPSLRELLGVLTVGGTLCLPEVDAQLDLEALGGHLLRSRPTTVFLVPSLARRVADVLQARHASLDDLRLAFFAGEVLPARVVEQWRRIAPRAEFVNLYGMTEGTLAQLYKRDVRAADAGEAPGVPVGRPRPTVSVTIDRPDAEGRGEVLVSSAAPARGILAQRPGPAPGTLHVDPMPPVLRTGDIGFHAQDGELVIVGRSGNDLKVSGKRVSYHRFVDEVEDLADVTQCVVVDRHGPHAFVAGAGQAPQERRSLRHRVREVAKRLDLPVPVVHLRRELPLLRSGKVDRIALAVSIDDTPAHSPVPTARDASVTDALLGLLGLDGTVTASTPFVDAGVSSLDMMGFALEVSRRFGLSLSVRDCYAHRDAASLARLIERTGATPAPPAPVGHGARRDLGDDSRTVPLSTRQVAYKAICMTDGNADWCNLSREVRLDRTVTPEELRAAVDVLIARHDALRLSLSADWSHQVYAGAAEVCCPVTVHEGSGTETDDVRHRALVQEARVEAVSRLIDPTAAPPMRVVMVPGTSGTSVLLVAHHLFVDGMSMDLLADELRSTLSGQPLETSTEDGGGFRAYCRTTRRSAGPTPDAAYWRALLNGAGQIELPQTTGEESRSGQLLSRPFGVVGSRAAHRLAAATGVSVFSIVLAAFDLAVSRTFGLNPLSIVVPVQVRSGVPTATAGMFTSQLVVRGTGSPSLRDNAREFAGQLEAGTAASAWEFDQRVEELGLTGSDRFPLSTVLFNQHPRKRGLRARDLGLWQARSLGRTLRYQLQGELQMSAAELALSYYYRAGIAEGATDLIDKIHRELLAALREAEGTPSAD
ncbi:AMP-binding protein [Streptomyces sp. NPDC014006]|uniref:AMP-binding protein n=1 Tax=Streptomyces sp. NPDC014006 TaxID=3364870 RepID=UPI0036F952DA